MEHWRRLPRWAQWAIGLFVGLFVLGAIIGDDSPKDAGPSPAATTATAPPAPTPPPRTTATAPPTTSAATPPPPPPAEDKSTTAPGPDAATGKDDPPRRSDRAIEQAKRFYFDMDTLAIQLDTAVGDQLNEKAGALPRIRRVATRISQRLNKWLLSGGGDTSVGGNLLLSAAAQAREAAVNENLARLADARRDIADAREKLAEEVVAG